MLVVLVAFSALMYGLQCFAWNQDTFSAMAFVEKLLKMRFRLLTGTCMNI